MTDPTSTVLALLDADMGSQRATGEDNSADHAPYILLADPAASAADLAEKWLARCGIPSRSFRNGEDALNACLKQRPTLALINASMMVSNGHPLFSVLKREAASRDIPIIALCNNPREAREALQAGVTDVVRKPVEWHIISRRAEMVCRTVSLKHQLTVTREALQAAEKKAASTRRHLVAMSDTDPLTGLLAVGKFRELLARALVNDDEVVLFIIGLERFALINEAFGRDKADRVLTLVGKRLREILVRRDLHAPGCNSVLAGCAAKMDSVRFGIFMPHNGQPEHLQAIRNALTETLAEPVNVDGKTVYLTSSIGGAVAPRDGSTAPVVIQNAERAMLGVKKRGGGFDFHREHAGLSSARFLELDFWLREAVDSGELKVAYQPLVNLWNNRIVGAEALLRWHREPGGNISPAEFIPVAERSGIVVQIGDFVIDTACKQLRRWLDNGRHDMRMAINLSLAQLRRGNVIESAEKAIDKYELEPQLLEFELSERGAIGNDPKIMRQLHQLKALGVRLSLDDFGTGDTSIEYLKRLPIDVLKLDRSYISGALENGVDAVIASALVGLARNMNLTVIAEGVESKEQYELLRSWGCHLYQGFYCSPAVFGDAFERLIDDQEDSSSQEQRV
ncbi:MAG: REC domain-containing phosphodiesterase [Pseudomonadota bacterium]